MVAADEMVIKAGERARTTQEKALDIGVVDSETVTGSLGAKRGAYDTETEAIAEKAKTDVAAREEAYAEAYEAAVNSGSAEKVEEVKREHAEELDAYYAEAMESVDASREKFLQEVQEDFGQTLEAFPEQKAQLAEAMKALALTDEINGIEELNTEAVQNMSDGLKEALKEYMGESQYAAAMGMAGQGDTRAIEDGLERFANELANVGPEQALVALKGTELGDIIANALQSEALEGIEGVDLTSAGDVLKLMMGELVTDAGEQLQTGGQEAASLFTAAAQGGVEQAAPSVANAVGNMGSAAVNALTLSGFDFATGQSAALQLGNGLVAGIEASKSRAVAAMRSLASDVNGAFERMNIIASPSKKYRWYGQMIGEGFALGVDDSVFRAEESVRRLTGMPERKAASGRGTGAGTAGTNYSINFYGSRIESEEDARSLMQRTSQFRARVERGRGA